LKRLAVEDHAPPNQLYVGRINLCVPLAPPIAVWGWNNETHSVDAPQGCWLSREDRKRHDPVEI
jgi:hypothetical protein